MEQAVEKYLSTSRATVKGHLNQQRMHARSTKIKEEEDCVNETETALGNGLNTHCVYAAKLTLGKYTQIRLEDYQWYQPNATHTSWFI
jgi:hypothetical protein